MMKLMGTGRFVRDPELRYVKDTCVCDFSLAVNEYRRIKGERKGIPHFFDFVIWDKAAQLIEKYCSKGDPIQIVATPRQDKWETNEGQKRSKVIFRVDEFTFLPRGGNGNSNSKSESDDNQEDTQEEEVPF